MTKVGAGPVAKLESREIARLAEERSALQRLAAELIDLGYSCANLSRLCGDIDDAISPVTHSALYSALFSDHMAAGDDATELLFALFWLGAEVEVERYLQLIPPSLRTMLEELGLVSERGARVVAKVSLIELRECLFLTDKLFENAGVEGLYFLPTADATMPPHASTLELLGGCRVEGPIGRLLDIGCGCGCLAILLGSCSRETIALDISPRSALFTRANALLNDISVEVRVDDVAHVELSDPVDLAVFNTPWGPHLRSELMPSAGNGRSRAAAVEFLNRHAPRLLTLGGVMWLYGVFELDEAGSDLQGTFEQEVWSDQITISASEVSPSSYALSEENIRAREIPPLSNLVRSREDLPLLWSYVAANDIRELVPTVLRATAVR